MQLQLDSGEPVERVVRLLADAVLALAEARGVQEPKLRLAVSVQRTTPFS
jgi:hypothetical protein